MEGRRRRRLTAGLPAVRDSLATLQALPMDNPCSFASTSAACRVANGGKLSVEWVGSKYNDPRAKFGTYL